MIAGVLFGLASMVAWGIADFLAARSSKSYGTLTTFFWMQTGGLILLIPLALWLDEQAYWTTSHWTAAAGGAFLSVAMYLLLYRGFERGLIAVVSPIFSAFVIFAVVVGLVLFRERLTPVQGLAVVLLIAGILLASSDWRQIKRWGAGGASTPGDAPGNTRGETGGETHRFTQGVPEAVCAMLTAGIFFSVLTYLARQLGWFGPILRIRIGAALVTGLLMLAIRHKPSLIHGGAYWILLAGMIDSLAYLAFNMGIRAAPAALIAPIAGSFSLVTILLVLIFFRERPAANQWAGIAAIIAGIIVMGVT